MRRFHLFELADQSWMPNWLRQYFYELLQHQVGRIYSPLLPQLKDWIETLPSDMPITDLASGSGGPWIHFTNLLSKQRCNKTIFLSDNPPINNNKNTLHYHPQPIDILDKHTWPEGAFTLFTALHHLSPQQVDKFLNEIVHTNKPIFIAEFTERKWSRILGMLLSPIIVAIDTPQIKPVLFSRLLFTYAIPLIPIIYLWDGAVSHMRSYTIKELQRFAQQHSTSDYQFEVIDLYHKSYRMRLTGLVGQSQR